MAVLIQRCTYVTTHQSPDTKRILLSAIVRYLGIMSSTAETTIGLSIKPPMKIELVKLGGVIEKRETEEIDDELFQDLIQAEAFSIQVNLNRTRKQQPFLNILYDEKTHHGEAIGLEFSTTYMEDIVQKFLSFVGKLNPVKTSAGRSHAESIVSRQKNLWEKILRKFLGDTISNTSRKLYLKTFEPGVLYLAIFGKLIKIEDD
ncbi:MAG: hypothetical protein GOU99_03710 [Candidatus Altiarchaeota archaeon]|nr:hypothetical protein [Candidatus Altiarchaeota archaeon]